MQFIPSKFQFISEEYGEVLGSKADLIQSLILRKLEHSSLLQMTNISNSSLLYRATRDGFKAQEFHRRCDGRDRTITVIKNNLNFVFGGYASSPWNSSNEWINDKSAFLFCLRQNNISCSEKFMNKCPEYALYGAADCGPTFGRGHEIYISNQSNITDNSFRNRSPSYDFPVNSKPQENLSEFKNLWRTTEIEIYQIN